MVLVNVRAYVQRCSRTPINMFRFIWYFNETGDTVFSSKGVSFLKCHNVRLKFQGCATKVKEFTFKVTNVPLKYRLKQLRTFTGTTRGGFWQEAVYTMCHV